MHNDIIVLTLALCLIVCGGCKNKADSRGEAAPVGEITREGQSSAEAAGSDPENRAALEARENLRGVVREIINEEHAADAQENMAEQTQEDGL